MKTKIYLCISVGLVLFLLGGLVMNQVVTAQVKMKPYTMPVTQIVWDYDSGWIALNQDETIILDHNLGGNPDEYFIYFTFKHTGTRGINNIGFGCYDTSSGKERGAFWSLCESNTISVKRRELDLYAEDIRIRILKNQ